MKFSLNTFSVALLLLSNTPALAHPTDVQQRGDALQTREAGNGFIEDMRDLWKRKGGGGGKGGGSSSSGSSSSSAGKGSSGSGSSSSSPKGSSSSNSGGRTKTGSGVTPLYGGGRYYGGGATTPYTAGSRSPLGLLAIPIAVGAAAYAFYPGHWPFGFYAYPYNHPYTFYNHSAPANTTKREAALVEFETRQTTTGANETKPVTCLCAMYAECGCDDNGNTTFLDSLIGDGTYSTLNLTLVNVADINGTSTIVLNGTLPNGTTASGGTENANAAGRTMVQASGYWVMIALVGMAVYVV